MNNGQTDRMRQAAQVGGVRPRSGRGPATRVSRRAKVAAGTQWWMATVGVGLVMAVAVVAGGCASGQSAKLMMSGDSAMSLGDYRQAAQDYEKAVALGGGDDMRVRLAKALIRQGKYQRALTELDTVSGHLASGDSGRIVWGDGGSL